MATSGSWDYSLTAADIINMAVQNLKVLRVGGTIVAAHQTMALQRLNVIAKQHQGTSDGTQGIKVHTRQRITLVLALGQQTYLIGPASTDARASTAMYRTTLDADEAAGQTTLSVTDTSDTTTYPGTTGTMTANDFIGIEQSDGTIFWNTVASISAGVSVTINTGLDVAAGSGAYVYWFTSRAQRFPVIESAVLREAGYTTTPLEVYKEVRQYEYGVSAKYARGTPTAMLVEPLRIATRVTLNSQPTNVQQQIVLTVLYPSEDYDATTDDIAFPQEALRFLSWELAFEIHPAFGAMWTPAMEKLRLESRQAWATLNPENSVLFYQPNA